MSTPQQIRRSHKWPGMSHRPEIEGHTEHTKSFKQRLEELLAVDHICSKHYIGHLPMLWQLRNLCHAPCELVSSG